MTGEDQKESSESLPADNTPTGGTQEEINKISEKTFHDDTSGSPTMSPQDDSHDSDKLVEPVGPVDSDKPVEPVGPGEPAKQDSDHYKPQLDDEGGKIFEFNTEEEFRHWSDHMVKDRDHMSNEEIVNEDSEMSYDKDAEADDNDVEESKMKNDEDKVFVPEDKEYLKNEYVGREEEEEEEEEEGGGGEEEEDQKEAQEADIEQNGEEEETFEGPSGIGHEEVVHTLPAHMTSHDHEQRQHEDLPSDVDTPTDDPELFEKIAEELAAANKQLAEWEELVEKELDDKIDRENDLELSDTIPVTTVTDSLEINPTTTHENTGIVTSVVMATADSNGMSGNEQTQGDDNRMDQLSNNDEKDNEIVKEQSKHPVIDEIQETEHSDNGELPEIQQKYEQDNLNISETSESHQKYEQEHYNDDEIPEIPDRHEKEEIANNSEQETGNVLETEDVRNDEIQKDDQHLGEDVVHDVDEGEKRDEEIQRTDDEKTGEDYSQREEEGKDLEKQNLHEIQQKDEKEDLERVDQKDIEDEWKDEEGKLHEDEYKDVVDDKKAEDEGQQLTEPSQEVQQPSVADNPPSVTVVVEQSTSILVAMTTHGIPMPHSTSSPLVTASSVSMTTDDRELEGDSHEVSEEKTVEVVHKPTTTTTDTTTAAAAVHHDDNQLRDIDTRQSEDVFVSGNVCVCVVCVCVCVCCVCVCV